MIVIVDGSISRVAIVLFFQNIQDGDWYETGNKTYNVSL